MERPRRLSTRFAVRRPRRATSCRAGRLVALLFVISATVLSTATAASAHAVVVSSQPGDRERLPTAPKDVSVTFSEPVSPELGGLTVLNAKGERVDNGVTEQVKPEVIQTQLNGDLPEGTYVTNYRVISADGHPVNGAIVFSVGTAIDEAGASGVKQQSNPAFDVLAAVGRFAAYLGGLLAAGLVFFAWFIHDQAADRSRLPRLVWVSAIVACVGQAIIVTAQAALASGSGLTAVVNPSLLTKVVGGSLGYSSAALVVGLAACAIAMRVRNVVVAQCLAFYGFVTVAVSYSLWGHEIESGLRWLSIGADVLHAATAALWFGGLVGLGLVLVGRTRAAERAAAASAPTPARDGGSGASGVAVLERVEAEAEATTDAEVEAEPAGSPADTVGIVIRFSTLATVSIVLLGVAGGVLAWLELGSFDALVSSTYGRTLIVKLVIVAAIVALAVYNHFRLLPQVLGETESVAADDRATDDAAGGPQPADEDDEETWDEPDFELPEWRRLLKTVRLEAIGIVAVLAVTAALVNITPGRTAAGDLDTGPFNATKVVGKGKVDLTIAPAKAGTNTMHITYLTADGRAAELAQSVSVEMSLPEKGVGPLTANATKAGLGHFIVMSTPAMSIPGKWKVTLVSRLGEFEQERTEFEVPIGEASG